MKRLAAAFAAFAFGSVPAIAADAIAFVTNVKGDVAIDGAARASLLGELAKGQKINVARDSQLCVMYIATGKEYILKGPSDYLVKDNEIAGGLMPPVMRSTEWRTSTKVLENVAQSSAASVRMRSVPKPRAEVPLLVFPTAGRVSTLQPVFQWHENALGGDTNFALYVPGEEKPLHTAKAKGANYRLPVSLRPDTEYVWTLASSGQEISSGRFRTLTADALEQVERRRPSERSEFSDRLLFTLMLQEMGAQQEAHESWLRLSRERADLPELAALAK